MASAVPACAHLTELFRISHESKQPVERSLAATLKTLACPICERSKSNSLLLLEDAAKELSYQFRHNVVAWMIASQKKTDCAFPAVHFIGERRVSLRDVFTKEILLVPVRGKDCSHVDCFELVIYLERWNIHWGHCELCGRFLPLHHLRIDTNLQNFCKQLGDRDSGHDMAIIGPDYSLSLPSDKVPVLDLDTLELEDRPVKEEVATDDTAVTVGILQARVDELQMTIQALRDKYEGGQPQIANGGNGTGHSERGTKARSQLRKNQQNMNPQGTENEELSHMESGAVASPKTSTVSAHIRLLLSSLNLLLRQQYRRCMKNARCEGPECGEDVANHFCRL